MALICCYGIFRVFITNPTEDPQDHRQDQVVRSERVSQDNSSPTATAKSEPSGFAARIVSNSDDAIWENDVAPGDFLMRLSVGEELKLSQGLVKLEFASKAIAVLRAPAELKILGRGEVLLERGKMTGRSEHGDFTVQTPNAYVVDVGTAFGVAVDDKAVTNVVVFDGEVHVRRSSASKQKVRLTSGMSVRADAAGLDTSNNNGEVPAFDRDFNGQKPNNLAPTKSVSLT